MDSTAVIKNDLHKLVVETEDINILEQVKIYFLTLQKETDWWNELSSDEKEQVENGLNQLNNNQSVPHEEVMQKALNRIRKGNR